MQKSRERTGNEETGSEGDGRDEVRYGYIRGEVWLH